MTTDPHAQSHTTVQFEISDLDEVLARLTHVELTNVVRETLLGGQMIDRAGMPHLIAAYGRDVMGQIAIDEWMGASPIYSRRTQELLGFGGPSVETLFKNIQLDIGAPPEFMDFQFRIDSDNYGEFWLDHCGALMDVEPMGEDYVHTMCHTIEDPTFDATAMAASPYARIRPIHRPPREPSDRHPHCHWYASIDQSREALQEPGITALIKQTIAAQLPLTPIAHSSPGHQNYSMPLENSLPLHEFSRGVLIALHQEVSLQWHLLVLACGAAIASRYGDEDAHEVLAQQFVGVAGLTAERLTRVLADNTTSPSLEVETHSLQVLAQVLALHPAWNPRSYIATSIELDRSGTQLRFTIMDCPAMHETQSINWLQLQATEQQTPQRQSDTSRSALQESEAQQHASNDSVHRRALQAIATAVDPYLVVGAGVSARSGKESQTRAQTWTITRSDEPRETLDEVKLTKFSQGAAFEFTSVPVTLSPRSE